MLDDDPVEMHVKKIESRRRAPVPKQPRLDVLTLERFAQERIIEQIDLPDGEIIGRPPIGVHLGEQVGGKRRGHCSAPCSTAVRSE